MPCPYSLANGKGKARKMDKYLLKCFALATGVLPEKLWRAAYSLADEEKEKAEEFRIRLGRPFCATVAGETKTLCLDGLPVTVTKEDIERCMELATKSSVHAYSHQIKQGFIALPYGGRMGICGSLIQDGEVRTITEISSLNIRIARQISGVSNEIFNMINWANSPGILIISKAGGGKTTFLRDIISKMSGSGIRTGLCDERYEIASCSGGKPYYDVGNNTDIISGGNKQSAADILIRTMSPEYIAFDEITQQNDAETLVKSSYMGASLIATAHCGSIDELYKRNIYKSVMQADIFDYIIKIQRKDKGREIILYEKGGQDGKANRNSDDNRFVRIFRKLHI